MSIPNLTERVFSYVESHPACTARRVASEFAISYVYASVLLRNGGFVARRMGSCKHYYTQQYAIAMLASAHRGAPESSEFTRARYVKAVIGARRAYYLAMCDEIGFELSLPHD